MFDPSTEPVLPVSANDAVADGVLRVLMAWHGTAWRPCGEPYSPNSSGMYSVKSASMNKINYL
jgi:hypothetical protein